MKNCCDLSCIARRRWKKIKRVMKLTLTLILFAALAATAGSGYSQSARINLKMQDASLVDVFREIERTSEFGFFFKSEEIDLDKRVSVNLKNVSIEEVLKKILMHNYDYRILDKNIVVTRGSFNTTETQQGKSVSGKVTDSSGSPLPGVSVVVKGTTNGTITDGNGTYLLSNIPETATLQFSFVGMKGQEVSVGSKTLINVKMEEDAIGLEEVVAVGYGTQRKKDLTGAVSTISAESLNETPILRLDEGLQGKISGVRVQNTDGTPGGGSKVRIRGSNSINFSNDPLYVVDGFIGADIATINAKDIQSIDILKDASSTAIYGSRGANGVVIITTNKPKVGDMKVSFDASYGIVNIPKLYPMSDFEQSLKWINEKTIAEGGVAPISADEMDRLLKQGGTDWQREVTQAGSKSDVNIGLMGGSEKLQYFLSGNFYDEKGVILNSDYRRYSLRSNIAAQFGEKVKLAFNSFGTSESRQGTGRLTNGMFGVFGRANLFPRVWPKYDSNGNLTNPDLMDNYKSAVNAGGRSNPLAIVIDPVATNVINTVQSNLDLTFNLADGLTLMVSNSGKLRVAYSASQSPIAPPESYRKNVGVNQYNGHLTSLMNYDVVSYTKKIGEHSLKGDIIYEFSKLTSNSNQISVSNLTTLGTDYYSLAVGSPTGVNSDYSEVKYRSYMGRLNYSFKDKYLITGSLRADGSSKFQKSNRWGYFPSAAFAWRLSEESSIKDIEAISNLKFRIGYGKVGNASIPAYSTLQLLTPKNALYDYNDLTATTVETGILPGDLVDSNIKWEVSEQFNAGLDWGLFNGRLTGVIDYYNKNIKDLIFKMSIPSINGTTDYLTNIGNISNSGIEFSLDGIILEQKDFSIKSNLNFALNKSEVVDLGSTNRLWLGADVGISNITDMMVVNKGEPLGQIWGYKYLGTWKLGQETEAARYGAKPGNARYEDKNNDGKYGTEDKQVIANTNPTTNIGFGLNMKYKNFDLTISGYGSFGAEIFNTRNWHTNQYDLPQMANRWTPDNQTDIPIWSKYSDIGWGQMTSQRVENGNFVKFSNLTLGYNLGKSSLAKIGLSNARIYLSGNNLLTVTKYSGLDPESNNTPLDNDAISGVDNFGYPSTRTFTCGINVSF